MHVTEERFTGIVWRVITPTQPILWPHGPNETWYMNPPTRYVITSDFQASIQDKVEAWSDLAGSTFYKPLNGAQNLANCRLLVERHRDRGIGDLLFTTGILRYLQHVNSHSARIYYYAHTGKGLVLHGNPDLMFEMTLAGPVVYDTLPTYAAHWFIASATEYDEEPEQANVYDVLFRQIGVDATRVPQEFKRPVVVASTSDLQRADDFFRLIYFDRSTDWRKSPFWIVAPSTRSTLRSANYGMWLRVIEALAKKVNVLVVGEADDTMMPETDMPFAEFKHAVGVMSAATKSVVNLIGKTSLRMMIGLVAKAEGLITLDSGLLYVAQGLRRPAVSLWGPQHPHTRIGYDQAYMDLAVWPRAACKYAPCFAYRHFPRQKCPSGQQQTVCSPLATITDNDVMARVERVFSNR